MNERHSAIRFVGGPWHNRIEAVPLRSVLKVTEPCEYALAHHPAAAIIEPSHPHHSYRLCQFFTGAEDENGTLTVYEQYVHESIPADSSEPYREHFQALPRSLVRAFEQKLLGFYRPKISPKFRA